MNIFRSVNLLPSPHAACVVTIGNFDGVHLGHRKMIEQVNAVAHEKKLRSVLLTFDPYPQEYFRSDKTFPRITRFRDKTILLQGTGIDEVLYLRFDKSFASQPAESFVRDLLVNRLNIKHIVIGDDFRFGFQRAGDFALLERMGKDLGFSVSRADTFAIDGVRVSSTRVRDALAANDLDSASRLLGRRYSICGRVVRGDQRGRTIGFPTANIHFKKKNLPLRGVFAVAIKGVDENTRHGVANIGVRPTVDGARMSLEVHIFDFTGDIYGRLLEIEFVSFVRAEKKFSNIGELKEQIGRDCELAKHFFTNLKSLG